MDKSLLITADMIALESMNPSQLLSALPSRLPSFLQDIKLHIQNVFSGGFWNTRGLFETKRVDRVIQDTNYVTLVDVEIFTPVGLSKPLLEYLGALQDSRAVTERLMSETLQPTLSWLAMLLTRPETLASIRGSHQETGIQFHDLKKHKLNIGSGISDKRGLSKLPYGKVYRRNSDLKEAAECLNDLNKSVSSIDKDAVLETVNEITSAFDKLMLRMKQNPETYKVSGITLNALARIALNLAEEVEFFAAHAHKVQEATETYKASLDRLEELAKTYR